jgi:hypothetical protein
MSELRALQDELKQLLFIGPSITKSRFWKDQIPERLDVYRNNVRGNWTETLDYDYPLTRQQFSSDAWTELEERYFSKFPPNHWELNQSIQTFLKFLQAQKVPAYVKELADFEWFDLKIFIDRSPVHKGSGLTNPTAEVRVYQHQIFYWVEAGAKADQPPLQKPEVLVFYRDSKNTCHIREADPLMLLLLEHYRKKGADLGELEAIRQRLLPQNKIPLETVLAMLKKQELILL